MKKEFLKFYLINFIFEIARTIPHAFVTIYLLSSGITIFQISVMQIIYMLSIILFEIPSGVISDHLSRKKLYFVACILMVLSYLLYIKVYSFVFIAIAQLLYGISSALQTGTIDALILNSVKDHGNEEKQKDVIGDFVRNSEIIMTIAMIVGSYIGTYLFHTYLKSKVYIISIVLFVISGILALFMKEDKAKQTSSKDIWKDFRKNCYQHLKQGLEIFLKNKKLLIIVSISASL